MNSLEQLQNINAPLPDPAARLRAKRAAMAEFRRIHNLEERQPATSKWSWKSPWLGGIATASVMVVGVSLYWLAPEEARQLQYPAPVASQVAPAAEPAETPLIPEVKQDAAVRAPASIVATRPTLANAEAAVSPTAVAASPLLARSEVTQAQPGDDELSMVMVTGTRVQTPAATTANPVESITGEQMRQLGMVNVADALLQLVPQNVSTGAAGGPARGGAPNAENNPYFTGNTIANLRGLDPTFGTRTLTTIDGRRVVSASNQADVVDLNTIPSNLLQRMDVVTGGASGTYGSGAMGVLGVVELNKAVPPASVATVPVRPDAVTGQFEQFEINPVKRVADEPESTFSIDVDTASYSFARRMLNQSRLPAMDAVRVEEMINYFDYAWPAPASRQEPLRSTVTVSDSPWGKGKKLIHIGIKGYELPVRGKPDSNIVFLLDVSGSMNAPDRLPLAVQSMKLLLDSLKPTDTVAIVVYAGAAGQVLAPTPVRNRAAIERALDSLRAGGSTAGAQGILLAYQLAEQSFRSEGVNRIFLTTDGDFNVGINNPNELKGLMERERGKGINLSVLTFGQGNTRDDIAQTLAQNGNGVAAYIDTLQEAHKVLVEEASSSLFTIASDVKIQVEFNPATVAEYRLVGYETRALKREDFNNDKVDAGDVGSGHKITAIYEITPVGSGAQLIDERRYTEAAKPATAQAKTSEYGFLKIRYKLPGGSESRLMETPIRQNLGVPTALRQDVAFSTAVAGFGQLLRGGKYTGAFSYDDVIRQADSARGKDEFGYRGEFVQLVRKARDVGAPTCANNPNIQQLGSLVNTYRQQVGQMLQRYNEQHPEVLAARAGLASAEASLAAEVARLSAAGLVCPATAQPMF